MDAETDCDLDRELLNKLNTLGTRDKEELVSQFQSVVGSQMSPGCCAFYLEIGNWNIQTALCAYYDIIASDKPPTMELVDETKHVAENSVSPNHSFTKTWRVRNNGTEPWPQNLQLRFLQGFNFGHADVVPVSPISPGETVDITLQLRAPADKGAYCSTWRLITLSGMYCGDPLRVDVSVDDDNILMLTQQLSTLDNRDSEAPSIFTPPSQPISTPVRPPLTAATPFCSPTGYGIFGGNPNSYIPSSLVNGHMQTLGERELTQQLHPRTSLNSSYSNVNSNDIDSRMDGMDTPDSRPS